MKVDNSMMMIMMSMEVVEKSPKMFHIIKLVNSTGFRNGKEKRQYIKRRRLRKKFFSFFYSRIEVLMLYVMKHKGRINRLPTSNLTYFMIPMKWLQIFHKLRNTHTSIFIYITSMYNKTSPSTKISYSPP